MQQKYRRLRPLLALAGVAAACAVADTAAWAQGTYRGAQTDVVIEKMPADAEEFIKLRDEVAKTPEGGAAIFVVALLKYAQDQKVGEQFLTIAIDGKWLVDGPTGYKGKAPHPRDMQTMKMRIADKPYVARSYVQGTSPDKGYAHDYPATIKILEQEGDKEANAKQKAENKLVKLFVYSTGADRPRPMEVNRNDKGIWKAYNWGSLEAGVRPPVEKVEDDI